MNHRFSMTAVVLLTVVAAWSGNVPRCYGEIVKFMTYNVESPGWNQNRRAQVVGAINLDQPDVLGLHEASASGNGAELRLDLEADYLPIFTDTGDPIYLRRDRSFQVVDEGVENLPAPEGGGPGVVLTWTNVRTPDGSQFIFYNTHFTVSFVSIEANQMQAVAAAQFISANATAGVVNVLAGDLNASQSSPTMLYLIDGQPLVFGDDSFENPIDFDDTWALAPGNSGLTHPGTAASNANVIIDWVLTDSMADVISAEVIQFDIQAGEEDNFSDHFPVTATVNLSPIPEPSTVILFLAIALQMSGIRCRRL